MKKKILVIEDWDKFWRDLRSCGYRWRDVTEHTAEKYYDGNVSIDTVMNLLEPHELEGVVEFEAVVIRQEKTLGAGKFINAKIPDNLDVKNGDKLHVFVVKQCEEKIFGKP